MSNAAFRMLAARTKEHLEAEDDRHEIDAAAAMHCLDLERDAGDLPRRLAVAVSRAATDLQDLITREHGDDPWYQSFAAHLDTLLLLLTELRGDHEQ